MTSKYKIKLNPIDSEGSPAQLEQCLKLGEAFHNIYLAIFQLEDMQDYADLLKQLEDEMCAAAGISSQYFSEYEEGEWTWDIPPVHSYFECRWWPSLDSSPQTYCGQFLNSTERQQHIHDQKSLQQLAGAQFEFRWKGSVRG